MKLKENKKKILSVFIIIVVILTIILNFYYIKYANGLTLIQLHDNSSRQMMGYVLKTKNKTVVIDGGLKEDAQNLIDNINRVGGGKVDVWFITHPHMDHAQAFMEIVQNTEIEIGKVYVTLNEIDWYKQNETSRIEEIQNFFSIIESDRLKGKVEEVYLNQTINIDNLECEIIGIKNPEITTNPINNSSMVIKMNINDKSMLFLADTGNAQRKSRIRQKKTTCRKKNENKNRGFAEPRVLQTHHQAVQTAGDHNGHHRDPEIHHDHRKGGRRSKESCQEIRADHNEINDTGYLRRI